MSSARFASRMARPSPDRHAEVGTLGASLRFSDRRPLTFCGPGPLSRVDLETARGARERIQAEREF